MKKCILYSVAISLLAMNGVFAQSVTILPNNETIAGDLTFAANANRLISINNGTSSTLSLRSGSAAVSNFATNGGSLVLQAGNGYNFGFYPYTGGDVYIRSGGNLATSSQSNGANIIFQTGMANNTNNDQWAEQMRIDYNGNVGIGMSPTNKLDVAGHFSAWGINGAFEELRTVGGTPYLDFSNDNAIDFDGRIILASDNEFVVSGANWGVEGNTYVNGNVGIGTNIFAAGEKLAISNGATQFGVFPGYYANTPNADWTTFDIPGTKGLFVWDNFSVNGNVGIGTSSPVAKLDVSGDVNITGKINNEAYIAPTLLNSWVNYDVPNGYATAAFYKDKENRVQLKGLLRSGTFTSGTVLFTLPVNYRPSQIMIYAVVNGSGFGRVDVYPNGDVKIASGGNDYVSLDGITFRATQ